jgi:Flp pilus assembly protein TadB
VSAAEDAVSLGMSLVAILIPALVILFLVVLVLIGWRLIRMLRKRRRRRMTADLH